MRRAESGQGSRQHLFLTLDWDTYSVLALRTVRERSQAIPLISVLMDPVQSLTGVVITADALCMQTGCAHYLEGRGAHYNFTVKRSQPTLLKQQSSAPREQGSHHGPHERHGLQIISTFKCATLRLAKVSDTIQAEQITR